MNTHRHDRRCPSPKAAGWWGRLIAAGLFAFYLNYVPVHLATATHLGGWVSSVADLVFDHGHDGHDDGDHDTDHHVPHPASDHNLTLNFTAQTQTPVAALAVFFLIADTSVLFCEPETQAVLPLIERLKPPGETPPDPLQPRAPPLA